MRHLALILVTLVATLSQAATTSAATPPLTHAGSQFFSRTQPPPCFAHPPKGFPKRLALGCKGPIGKVVSKGPTAIYRFRLRAGRSFRYEVVWGGHRPKVTTSQSGRWSFVTVHGPRKCAVVDEIFRVTIVPR